MNRTHIIAIIIEKFKLFSFLVFILCLSNISTAQTKQLKFTKIEGSNGVTLGKINAITEDQNGFMWFTDQTNGALIRYDGNHMTQYRHDPKDPNSLGGDYPECLFADPSGNIWIGAGGLNRLDPVSGTFTHYRHDPNNPKSLSSHAIWAIHMDHLGYLWVGTAKGLDRLDLKTGKFDHFSHDPNNPKSLSHNLVRAIYEDLEGTLWIGTGVTWDPQDPEGGLNKFDRSKGTFTRYLHDPTDANSLVSNKVRAIFEDSKGNFWVGTDKDGLHTLDRKTGKFTRYPYDPKHPEKLSRPPTDAAFFLDHITFILEDAEEKLWIGTLMNGINRYDPVSQKITHFGNDEDKSGAFLDNTTWWAHASSDGLVWLSTQDDHLYKIDLHNIHIPHFKEDGLPRAFLEEAPFFMWMGTNTGLVRKNLKNGTSQRFVHEPLNENSINHNFITKLFKDKEGVLWVGTPEGLNRYDAKTGNFTRYQPDPNDATSLGDVVVVSDIIEDRDLNLWVGTAEDGLNLLDRDTGKFTHYRPDDEDPSSIGGDDVSVVLEGEKNELWIGLRGKGISKMDRKSGKFKQYLPGIGTNDLYKDKAGIIWAGTRKGLYRYHKTLDDFYPLSKDSTGIDINSFVMSIIADNEDNLWISSLSGIYKLNNSRDILVHFGKESGVIPVDKDRLVYATGYKASDDKLFFCDTKGYYAFYPAEFNIPLDESPLYFTSFWLNNRFLVPDKKGPLKEALNDTKEILLDHDQNEFAFTFTSIDYRTSGDKIIYYQLENYDTDWRKVRVEEKVNYFKVPPGNYNFRLKALNGRNGVWSEKSIALIVTPPWWTTWWAYGLYFMLFAVAVYAMDRYKRKRILEKAREATKEKELVQAKEIKKAYAELKATQSQLIHSEKMASLGELTAGIAHEIQNPLNFVNNFSEVNREMIEELKEEKAKNKKVRDEKLEEELLTDIDQNLEKISHHGKRADAIVKGMLQHSRSSSGVKEPTDINALADEYLRLAYHGLRAKDKSFNATMKTDFDKSIGTINIIPQDIGRVILNLITNAFYACTERSRSAVNEHKKIDQNDYEPTVIVTTKKEGDKALISVKDNGNGIPKKVLDKIFQPFFTTKPAGQGTGLGLSMSYDIVTKGHGGSLEVKSEEQKGSEFIIILPMKNTS
jgi:signal transduction histidine kinase/ligand-binding sensor domain-containing protein